MEKKRLRADVSKEFHMAVKVEATKEGKTIKQVIVDLLKAWLKERGIEVE